MNCVEFEDEALFWANPNADNVNDIFYVRSKGLTTLQVEIYNRWGMRLYEFDTVNGGWDGRTAQGNEAPDGTYYYILKAVLKALLALEFIGILFCILFISGLDLSFYNNKRFMNQCKATSL